MHPSRDHDSGPEDAPSPSPQRPKPPSPLSTGSFGQSSVEAKVATLVSETGRAGGKPFRIDRHTIEAAFAQELHQIEQWTKDFDLEKPEDSSPMAIEELFAHSSDIGGPVGPVAPSIEEHIDAGLTLAYDGTAGTSPLPVSSESIASLCAEPSDLDLVDRVEDGDTSLVVLAVSSPRLPFPHSRDLYAAPDYELALQAAHARNEELAKVAAGNKVSTRVLAAEILAENPELPVSQPAFVDIRALNTGHRSTVHILWPVKLENFPLDKVRAALAENRVLDVCVENASRGFVVHVEGSSLRIRSKNPVVVEQWNRILEEERTFGSIALNAVAQALGRGARHQRRLNEQRLVKLLEALGPLHPEHGFGFHKLEDRSETEFISQQGIAEILAAAAGGHYLKSTITAGGKLIVKVEDGAIMSDSSDFTPVVRDFADRFFRAFEGFRQRVQSGDVAKVDVEAVADVAPSLPNILRHLIGSMQHPVLEKEFVGLRGLHGERCEGRAICIASDPAAPEMIELRDAYIKVSTTETAANISLGGKGKDAAETFREFLTQLDYRPEPSPGESAEDALEQFVTASVQHYEHTMQKFARAYVNKFKERYPGYRAPPSFAVDCWFQWDPEKAEFTYTLVEIQRSFGFEGLRQCRDGENRRQKVEDLLDSLESRGRSRFGSGLAALLATLKRLSPYGTPINEDLGEL